jgi:transposase-like protein
MTQVSAVPSICPYCRGEIQMIAGDRLNPHSQAWRCEPCDKSWDHRNGAFPGLHRDNHNYAR